jgi:diacylglycerol diphosphate phosphatase/phosphatidate phosphatase
MSGDSETDISSSRIFRSALLALAFFMLAWHYPRILHSNETTIATKTPPYQQTQAGDVILNFELNHPFKHATIQSGFLVWSSVYLPFALLILLAAKDRQGRMENIASAISGFATAVGLTEATTNVLKHWILRERPNYYSLCGFDVEKLICTADLEDVREANLSFPSGHSSLSCCGMTFLVWYFLGNINKTGRHPLFYALNTILPLMWTIFVSVSRIADKWHHPSDVLFGLGLGFSMSTIAYHTWYPTVWSKQAGVPRLMLMDSNSGSAKVPGTIV